MGAQDLLRGARAPDGRRRPAAAGAHGAGRPVGELSRTTLVTGGRGFAGRHLVAWLGRGGHEVVAPSHAQLDLLDAEAVRRWVGERRPERVFHLAALASVGRSWDEPERTLAANTAMTLHVLEAVRSEAPAARVLIAGSGEVYGPPERLPVDEEHPLRPQSPYAVSKATGDLLAGQYADAHGLHVVRSRAFNHAGPGQGTDYVVGTLTDQVARAERAGAREVVVRTGNPDARRDFTDVRDVARAYALLVDQAAGAYNVCSGGAVSVRELVELLRPHTRLRVRHEIDPARLRPADVPEITGTAQRLLRATGWQPAIPLATTVGDALAAWGGV